MAVRPFELPDLGEGLEDAEIVTWHVSPGDRVELNQPLCTVETAKAEVDLPSPFAGTVAELGAAEGDIVLVGQVLVSIETSDGSDTVIDLAAEGAPVVEEVAREPMLVGFGADLSTTASRRRRRPRGPAASPGRVLAKPPVRKLARDLGIDLASLAPGTGPQGSVTRDDLTAAATAAASRQRPAPRVVPAGEIDVLELRGVRARMAEAMTRSHTDMPTAGAGRWVDCTKLLALRAELRSDIAPDQASTVTPFGLIAWAIVQALHEHKVLNSAFDPGSNTVHRYRAVHLGIAVDTPRGLLVPVVHDADRLEALGFLAEVGRLVQAARSGTLAPAELVGSTCSVSNFGAFGLDDGWSLLNPPEAAIVGVGSIRERAVAVDGALAVRTTAKLTCTFDHRVADGADVGGFLGVLAQLIEAPEGLRHG